MKLPKYFTERKHEQYHGNWWATWHTGFEMTVMNILVFITFAIIFSGIGYLIWSETIG